MKKHIFILSLIFILQFITFRLTAQLAINTNGSAPDSSAMLDVVSTNRGILLPCLTREQIRAIQNPANGLLLFCTTNKSFYIFHASNNVWKEVSYGLGRITQSAYCGYDFIDQRDGRIYQTVLIGNQCWMAQNLNIGIPVDGNMDQEKNEIIEKYCYNDFEDNCDVFGGLYQWNEMMQFTSTPGGQGICPAGWHIPTDAEWTTLTAYLGGEGIAGGKMKSADLWNSPNTGATNSSNFTAIPGGIRNNAGFDKLNTNIYFWSSTSVSVSDTNILTRELGYNSEAVSRIINSRINGASVRCVK